MKATFIIYKVIQII